MDSPAVPSEMPSTTQVCFALTFGFAGMSIQRNLVAVCEVFELLLLFDESADKYLAAAEFAGKRRMQLQKQDTVCLR